MNTQEKMRKLEVKSRQIEIYKMEQFFVTQREFTLRPRARAFT